MLSIYKWSNSFKSLYSSKLHIFAWNINILCTAPLFGTWLGMIRITWGKSPEWFGRNPRLTKGHYRCTANLCYQVKLRYEASQVWLNATFYSTRSAVIGLEVETWRVKTEIIIITILHIIIITTSILTLASNNCAKSIGAHKMHK